MDEVAACEAKPATEPGCEEEPDEGGEPETEEHDLDGLTPGMQAAVRSGKVKKLRRLMSRKLKGKRVVAKKIKGKRTKKGGKMSGDHGVAADEPETAELPKKTRRCSRASSSHEPCPELARPASAKPKAKGKAKAKAKASTRPKAKPKAKAKAAAGKSKARATVTELPEEEPKKAPKKAEKEDRLALNERRQGQLWLSDKKWVFKIIDGQYYGCKNCRFLYYGCKSCQKEGFRGIRAAEYALEDEEYNEALKETGKVDGEWPACDDDKDPEAPPAKRAKIPKKKKGKRSGD